jgi:nucleotide-binding universal stress UspA family protein
MTIAFTALLMWAFAGVLIAWLSSRHGHNFWIMAVIGLAYGPLLVLIWIRGLKGQQTGSRLVRFDAREQRNGWIDVLVGLDGTSDCVESTGQALSTLGDAVGRVQLASVLDHEVFNSHDMFSIDERRIHYLQQAATKLALPHAELSLISGQPDKALHRHAAKHGFDLLVVSHRRAALPGAIRGSTATRLARSAEVPVLIGPATAATPRLSVDASQPSR